MRSSFWSAFFMSFSVALASSNAFAAYPNCFTGTPTPADLTSWRADAAAAVPSNGGKVAKNIQSCFPTTIPQCLKRTFNYGSRNDVAAPSAEKSYADTPEKQPPPELLAPGTTGFQYFVRPDIEAFAKSREWPVARYKSRHSGGFDGETSSLLMVYVPGDKVVPPVNYDRWINFALPADNDAEALHPTPQVPVPTAADFAAGGSFPSTFTLMSLTRATDTTAAQLYFQMFGRGSGGVYTPTGNVDVDQCVRCHPNGMRAISPLGFHVKPGERQLPEEAWHAVQAMNEAMDDASGGKLVSWRDAVVDASGTRKAFMHPESQWPIIGATRPLNGISRTEPFIMGGTLPDGTTTPGCYNARTRIELFDIFGRPPGEANVYVMSDSPSKDWRKVRNAMNCEACHNNRQRYALSKVTDVQTVDYKILVDLSMPPGLHQDPLERGDATLPPTDALTLDERMAVANCLQEELKLESKFLNKWLTQEACQ